VATVSGRICNFAFGVDAFCVTIHGDDRATSEQVDTDIVVTCGFTSLTERQRGLLTRRSLEEDLEA
jgi:hypothetical protein